MIAGLVFLIWGGFVNKASGKIPLSHNEVLELHKLEALLWERNPSLEIFRLQTRSAESEARGKKHLYGPSFHSRYTYHPESDTFNDAFTSSIHRSDFYLSYPLLEGIWRRKYEYRQSKSREQELVVRTRQRWNDLLYRLRIHYICALEAAELAAGFRKSLENLSTRIKPFHTRIEAQEALPVELLELEKLILEADVSRLEQEKRRRQARNAIASLICLEPKSFLLPESASISWGEPPPEAQLKEWACQKRSDLAIFSTRLMREQASSDAFPYRFFRLDLTAGYTIEEDDIEGFESGSQFGLHLQIPIMYQELVNHRRVRQLLNQEVLRKEIYAGQIQIQNKISSVYENLKWLQEKEKVIGKDSERLREILRIALLRRNAHTGEKIKWDSYKTEYQLWLAGAEKIRLRYDRMRNLDQLLHLAEIPHFDQMRKIGIKHPKNISLKKRLILQVARMIGHWTDMQMEFLLYFLKKKGISQVFWEVNHELEEKYVPIVSKYISLLHKHNIPVTASFKVLKASGAKSKLPVFIEHLLDYNRNVSEDERFEGVHLTFSAGYIRDISPVLVDAQDKIGGEPLRVYISIPFPPEGNLHNKNKSGFEKDMDIINIINSLFSLCHQVILQVYGTKKAEELNRMLLSPQTVIPNNKAEKIWIGLQTEVFLQKEGETDMLELMEASPYTGFVINDYNNWRELIMTPPQSP